MSIRDDGGMRRIDRWLRGLAATGLVALAPGWALAAGAGTANAPVDSPAPRAASMPDVSAPDPSATDPAEIAARKAWQEARVSRGDDHPETLSAAREYAFELAFNQKVPASIALMTDTLERVRRLTGAGSQETATIASDLGWVLMDSERYAEAEAPLSQAWSILKSAKPPKDGPAFRVLVYLATTQTALGRGADRLLDYDAVIAARRAVFGETGDTLNALSGKSDLLVALKRGGEAEPLLRQIIEARQAEGGDPRDLLRARKRLAECLRSLGRLEEAAALYREVWLAEQALPDPSGIYVMISPDDLVSTLRQLGRASEAADVLRATWETQKRTLGADNGITQLTARSVAEVLGEMGADSEEEAIRRQYWLSRRKALGENHLAVHLAAIELASSWLSLGRVAEAEPLAREALAGLRRTPTALRSDVVNAVGILASILYSQGRYAEAEKLEAESLASLTATEGPEARATLVSAASYAAILDALGRSKEAEARFRQVLEIRRRVFGASDPDTLSSLNALAVHLVNTGRGELALPLLREQAAALETQSGRSLVPTGTTISAYANLGYVAGSLGERREAYQAFSRAAAAVQQRYASREASGGAVQAKTVLVRYRYVFTGQISAGWSLAHEK